MLVKKIWVVSNIFIFVFFGLYFKSTDSTFIGLQVFSYICYRLWGDEKPDDFIAWIWDNI